MDDTERETLIETQDEYVRNSLQEIRRLLEAEEEGNDVTTTAPENNTNTEFVAMPPFGSEEPIERFENAAGVKLPQDLRHHLLHVSREYPVEGTSTYRAKRSCMLYRAYHSRDRLLLSEYEWSEPEALEARLLPQGSDARRTYERMLTTVNRVFTNHAMLVTELIPYALAHAAITNDPSYGTDEDRMWEVEQTTEELTSLAQAALHNGGVAHAVTFVRTIMKTMDFTLDQLVFSPCSVQTLQLSRFDVGYGAMLLVTSPGPYEGWILGSHYMDYSSYQSAFPSFTHYRLFRETMWYSFSREA